MFCRSLKNAFLVVLTLTFFSQAFGQGIPESEPRSSTIRGTVINAITQSPISRALVYSADNRFAMLTDGEGHFEFTLPMVSESISATFRLGGFSQRPLGDRFLLMARKPGFLGDLDESAQALATAGEDVTIALSPEAIIKGRVATESGEPAMGVNLQLFSREVQGGLPRWMPGRSAITNSAGEFRFAELRPGAYKLVTREWMDNDPLTRVPGRQMFGYPPAYYSGAADFSAASTIELAVGQMFEADISIGRQPYFSVRIPVANPEVGGVNVYVQGQLGPGYSLGYNPEEHRIEGLLPSGNYVVEAMSFGMNSVSGTANVRVAGAPLEAQAIRLVPNSVIPIQVKEEFSDNTWQGSASWNDGHRTIALHGPRAYLQAQVESADELEQQRGGSIRPPTSPHDDSLVLENLVPGRYWLRLTTSRGYVASASTGSTDLLRQPLVVGSGPAAPIEVTVRDDSAALEGTVSSLSHSATEDNRAMSQSYWIYCVPLPDSTGQFQEFQFTGEANFNVPTMAPGDYRIMTFSKPQPRLPYRDPQAMKAYESKGQAIHLDPGQKAQVQLQVIAD